MTGSVAIDVAIGLVFIYLLYSLFATLLAEIVSTNLMLRARNLREAVNRMINDEEGDGDSFPRFMELFNIVPGNYVNDLIAKFYNHQEVKYLGRKAKLDPSAIKAANFAKVIIDGIKEVGTGATEIEKIKSGLERLSLPKDDTNAVASKDRILGIGTAKYILSIWEDCENRVDQAKNQIDTFIGSLENWFDRTMEQTTEWYKQRMQKVLLIIGFALAWVFNVDTFAIVKKLSIDQDAREQMVQLASAYLENNDYEKYTLLVSDSLALGADTLKLDSASKELITNYNARLDSVLATKKVLEQDMASANTVLGLGSWLPDSMLVDKKKGLICPEWVSVADAKIVFEERTARAGWMEVTVREKWKYLFLLLFDWPRIIGYFITALAISLGAPFWFDTLNKLMKLRGALSEKK